MESKSTPTSLPEPDERESGDAQNSLLHRLRPRVGTVVDNVVSAAILALAAITITLCVEWRDEKRIADLAQAELVRRLERFTFVGYGLEFGKERLTAVLDRGFEYRQDLGCHSFPQLVSALRDDAERLNQREADHLFSLYGLAKSVDIRIRRKDAELASTTRESLRQVFAKQFTDGVSVGAGFVDWSTHAANFRLDRFPYLGSKWYPRDDCNIQ